MRHLEKFRRLALCFVLVGIVAVLHGAEIPWDDAPVPTLRITMSQAVYLNGQTVTAMEFLLQNPSSTEVKVEFAVWLEMPGLEPISILNLGADNTLSMPPNLSQELGPLTLFAITPAFPRGSYAFSSRMVDPVTKKFLSEDLNPFLVQ